MLGFEVIEEINCREVGKIRGGVMRGGHNL
jgi:hypothetical protein